jgi:hypothetical protein
VAVSPDDALEAPSEPPTDSEDAESADEQNENEDASIEYDADVCDEHQEGDTSPGTAMRSGARGAMLPGYVTLLWARRVTNETT